MALRELFADLLDTPANPANPAKTRAGIGLQPDSAACESLRILRIVANASDPNTGKFAEFAGIRKLENVPQTRANPRDSQNSQHSQGGNPLMTREQADAAHRPCWTSAEIDRTVARIHVFQRRGVASEHAEHVAERLLLRDRDQDDRTLCLECRHLRGKRCTALRIEPLTDRLQRCPAFADALGGNR